MSTVRLMRGMLMLALALPLAATGQGSPPVVVGVVSWPLDSTDALHALGGDFEACLTRHIRAAAPEISVLPQRAVRDALFPLLEPATQPADEAAFGQLLARDDVRARLRARGVRYLVAFAGGTRKEDWRGGILCGAGYGGGGCLGFAWRDERTVLDAALWSLDGSPSVHHEGAKSEARSIIPAFVLPLPLMAQTRAGACRELGTRIAKAIREAAAHPAGPEPSRQPGD